jgi:hypothetical protein
LALCPSSLYHVCIYELPDIVHLVGFRSLVEGWLKWREHIRSHSRQRGFDFLTAWLPENAPDRIK